MRRRGVGLLCCVAILFGCLTGCGVWGPSKSALAGRWVPKDTLPGREFPQSYLELFGDGTGGADGRALNWSAERGRLLLNVSRESHSYSYQVSGDTLTLTGTRGRAVYEKEE